MAVTTSVLSGTIDDLIGSPDPKYLARLVLVVESNTTGSTLIDTSGNRHLAGAKRVTIDKTTGAYSVTLVRTNSADIVPATGRLYRATLIYPSGTPGSGNQTVTSGWFALTADASLADVWTGIETLVVSTSANLNDVAMTNVDALPGSTFRVQQDARVLARGNHTGTQAAGTITGLAAVATSGSASDITTGTLPNAVLPPLAITVPFAVASQAAMLALTAQQGDVAIRSDLNKSFILSTNAPTVLADWLELLTPTDTVLSVAGKTGVVSLVKADVGLGSVDNIATGTTSGTIPVLGASGTLAVARLATGTPDGTKFVRDDGTLAVPAGAAAANASRLTAAVTASSSTYVATGLTVNLAAGKAYRIKATGQYRCSVATRGIGLRLNGTATATGIRNSITIWGTATSASTPLMVNASALATANAATTTFAIDTDYLWEIEGLIRCNAAGTLIVEFNNSVAAISTIQPDCFLHVTELP